MLKKIIEILLKSFPEKQIRDGSPLKDLVLKPTSALNEALESEKINFSEKAYLSNYKLMTPSEFDINTSNYINTRRKLGKYSMGQVRIYVSQRTDIVFDSIRSQFKDINGRTYVPRFDFAISVDVLKYDYDLGKYYIDIPVISDNILNGNVVIKAGEINKYLGSNPYVENVINLNDFVIVDLVETNTELYNRITEKGIVLNSTRNNYYANLLYQNFPDIRKLDVIGTNNPLMRRDLTFESGNLETIWNQYTFFGKRQGSNLDNQNSAFKGLLFENEASKINSPEFLLVSNQFKELNQQEYEAIAHRDKNPAVVSSLIKHVIFSLYAGINDFTSDSWAISENYQSWDRGSSFINFTSEFERGVEIKGNYLDPVLLAKGDRGLVMYREHGDIRNTEFLLSFIIDDFKYDLNTGSSDRTGIANTITVSNNNPLYFTVLKNGVIDKPSNFQASTIDGYGVVIMKSFPDSRPNVFIIDGSSAVGSVAFEDEIMQLGSERILAADNMQIEPGQKYTVIMQINESYGMTVTIRNQFDNEVGQLKIGSGQTLGEYITTYTTRNVYNTNTVGDVVADAEAPLKIKITTGVDETVSSFNTVRYVVAQGSDADHKIIETETSQIVKLFNDSVTEEKFSTFYKAEIGDILKVNNREYIITNVLSYKSVQLDRPVLDLDSSRSWKIWRPLEWKTDYNYPEKDGFQYVILLKKGIQKIKDVVGSSNFNSVNLEFNYINNLGANPINFKLTSDITNKAMKAFNAGDEPDKMELLKTYVFNQPLVVDNDYFIKTITSSANSNFFALTQKGFNSLEKGVIYLNINDGSNEESFYIEKGNFERGYICSLPNITDVDKITFLNRIFSASTNYHYEKNTHYKVFGEKAITDFVVLPNYITMFNEPLKVELEVVGTGIYTQKSSTFSTKGGYKLYCTDSDFSGDRDYFSVIINSKRYLIKKITADATSPYINKKTEVELYDYIEPFEEYPIILRKSIITQIDNNFLKFGYRYNTEPTNSSIDQWDTTGTWSAKTTNMELFIGEDFEYDRLTPVNKFYLSENVFNSLEDSHIISFYSQVREILEERNHGRDIQFRPLSHGSYLGIGFKTVSNGYWKLLEFKQRKLSETYSSFLLKFKVGDQSIDNEDRIVIDSNIYALNNSIKVTPKPGAKLMIYNFYSLKWEQLFENDKGSYTGSFKQLKYSSKDEEKFKFGYYDGSEFIVVNNNFLPTSHVTRDGYLYLLAVSRGKNEKDFSGNSIFGEAKLFLDYVNIKWLRNFGIHLGNKMDIWVASDSEPLTETTKIQINTPTKVLAINDELKKPIKSISKIENIGTGVLQAFELSSTSEDLRYSTKEVLQLNFPNLVSGEYNITYEYYPHLSIKQSYIDGLETHIDCLVKQFVPVNVKINLGYLGNLNIDNAKEIIYNYIRFSNIIDINVIIRQLEENEGVFIQILSSDAPIEVMEYDLVNDPIQKKSYSLYSIKSEKYFEINKNDINLVKLK